MVEDALKTTRNLQRLLLVVGAVAFVFLASLGNPERERTLLANLQDLRILIAGGSTERYGSYGLFVERAWRKFDGTQLGLLHVPEEVAGPHFDLPALFGDAHFSGEALELLRRPLHIGRIQPQTLFSDPRVATLTMIREQSFHLPLYKWAQVTLIYGRELPEDLAAFLDPKPSGGDTLRGPPHILDLRLDLAVADPAPDSGHSFLAASASPPAARLSFVASWSPDESRTFRGIYPTQQYWLPETSWDDWWTEVVGLPPLELSTEWERSVEPPLDADAPLIALEEELSRKLDSSRADSRAIDFLGISMPGKLALFGIPVAIGGLLLSLLLHVRHLHRLVDRHREAFREFSWPALAPEPLGFFEPLFAGLLLPLAIHVLLGYRAAAFGDIWLARAAAFSGGCLVLGVGGTLLISIGELRRTLQR